MVGLLSPPREGRAKSSDHEAASVLDGARGRSPVVCAYSGTLFIPHRAGQVYCSKTCALAHARQLAEKVG